MDRPASDSLTAHLLSYVNDCLSVIWQLLEAPAPVRCALSDTDIGDAHASVLRPVIAVAVRTSALTTRPCAPSPTTTCLLLPLCHTLDKLHAVPQPQRPLPQACRKRRSNSHRQGHRVRQQSDEAHGAGAGSVRVSGADQNQARPHRQHRHRHPAGQRRACCVAPRELEDREATAWNGIDRPRDPSPIHIWSQTVVLGISILVLEQVSSLFQNPSHNLRASQVLEPQIPVPTMQQASEITQTPHRRAGHVSR